MEFKTDGTFWNPRIFFKLKEFLKPMELRNFLRRNLFQAFWEQTKMRSSMWLIHDNNVFAMTVTFIVILSVKAGTGSRMFFIHQKPMEPMEKFHRFFCSQKSSIGFIKFHRFSAKFLEFSEKVPWVSKSSMGFKKFLQMKKSLCFQIKNLSGFFSWF